jgi:hypothetical protein
MIMTLISSDCIGEKKQSQLSTGIKPSCYSDSFTQTQRKDGVHINKRRVDVEVTFGSRGTIATRKLVWLRVARARSARGKLEVGRASF